MKYKRIFGVAACDPKGVIGNNGRLPWHYPEELLHFARTIDRVPLIMGRRTYASLPQKYIFKRPCFVFSRTPLVRDSPRTVSWVSSLTDFFSIEESYSDLCLIGGEQIYTLFLSEGLVSDFILTRIHQEYDGDAFFPYSFIKNWDRQLMECNKSFAVECYKNILPSLKPGLSN